jgi:hypothetical protein
MNRYKFLLFGLSICIFSSCTTNVSEENTFDPNAAGYQVNLKKIVQGDIEVETSLKDDLPNGELILLMTIKNNSGDAISIDYPNCGLSVNVERVVVPEFRKSFKAEIPDGAQEDYEIYFYPINTLDFYYNTDYRGDMKQSYSLKLDFIRDKHQNQLMDKVFTYQLSDTAYQNYLNTYARERHMQIFAFESDTTFVEKQTNYLKKILPEKKLQDDDQPQNEGDFIFAENPGITVNKRLVKVNAYRYKDTLVVNMRMVNQDANSLKVLRSKCNINALGRVYSPASHFSDSFESGHLPDSTYIFKPGTRLHLLLKYYIPEKLDKWELDMDWLLVDATKVHATTETWKRLLQTDLVFRPAIIGIEN